MRRTFRDKRPNVNIDESGHEELAVKSVHHAAVARNDVSEIFDLKSPFETAREESSERSNDAAEEREGDGMKHEWVHQETFRETEKTNNSSNGRGQRVFGKEEDGGRYAGEVEAVGDLAVLHWASEESKLAQKVRHDHPEEYG